MSKILVMGELCIDVIIRNPKSVPVFGIPVWAEDISFRLGGSASYVSQALNYLGAEVFLCSMVGEDFIAYQFIDKLKTRGINTDYLRFLPGVRTNTCIGTIDGKNKSFVGCSPFLGYPLDLLTICTLQADLVYFGGYLLYPELWQGDLAAFFHRAQSNGAKVIVDTQMLPIPIKNFKDQALTSNNFASVDVLLVDEKEAIALTGCRSPEDAALAFQSLGPTTIVIKLGRKGSLTWTPKAIYSSKSFSVPTWELIGAGDFYGAGFSYALLHNWDLASVSAFANAFTALAISRPQDQALPSPADVKNFLKEQGFNLKD